MLKPSCEFCKNCKKEFEGQFEYGEPLYNKLCLKCRETLQIPCDSIKDEFKIGDKVVLQNNTTYGAKIGATGEIIGIEYRAVDYIDVVWDRNELWNNQQDGGYEPDDSRLIKLKEPN